MNIFANFLNSDDEIKKEETSNNYNKIAQKNGPSKSSFTKVTTKDSSRNSNFNYDSNNKNSNLTCLSSINEFCQNNSNKSNFCITNNFNNIQNNTINNSKNFLSPLHNFGHSNNLNSSNNLASFQSNENNLNNSINNIFKSYNNIQEDNNKIVLSEKNKNLKNAFEEKNKDLPNSKIITSINNGSNINKIPRNFIKEKENLFNKKKYKDSEHLNVKIESENNNIDASMSNISNVS